VPKAAASVLAPMRHLRLLALDEPWAIRHFVVCYRSRKSLSPAGLLLLDFLCASEEAKRAVTLTDQP
jgi:DNA-binding transcriptional LysR family regulator